MNDGKVIFVITFFLYRISHQRCSVIKGVLRNFAKFSGKHQCQGPFLNKVAGHLQFNLQAEDEKRVKIVGYRFSLTHTHTHTCTHMHTRKACQKYEGRTACTIFWFLWPICIPHFNLLMLFFILFGCSFTIVQMF